VIIPAIYYPSLKMHDYIRNGNLKFVFLVLVSHYHTTQHWLKFNSMLSMRLRDISMLPILLNSATKIKILLL